MPNMGFFPKALFVASFLIKTSFSLEWNGLEYGLHLPDQKPGPGPVYMVDNTNNQYGVAPDHGTLNAPVLSGPPRTATHRNHTGKGLIGLDELRRRGATGLQERDGNEDFWLSSTTHGEVST